MADQLFWVNRSLRLPGLGVLLLPRPPAPAWLAAPPLHAALPVRLHCPGQPPRVLPATIEEISPAEKPAVRALLLDADEVSPGTWLEILPPEFAFTAADHYFALD